MNINDGIKHKGKPYFIPDCSRDDLPKFFKERGFKVGAEIGSYTVSVFVADDGSPTKHLARKTVEINAGQSVVEMRVELGNKLISFWWTTKREEERRQNMIAQAQLVLDAVMAATTTTTTTTSTTTTTTT